MARLIRAMVAVTADKLADLMDLCETVNVIKGTAPVPAATTDDDDSEVPGGVVAAKTRAVHAVGANGGRGRPALYTPTGTAKQVAKVLESLQRGSLSAYVLADLARNPNSRKADMLTRLGKLKPFKSGELSIESVDNTVWNLQKKGIIESKPAD